MTDLERMPPARVPPAPAATTTVVVVADGGVRSATLEAMLRRLPGMRVVIGGLTGLADLVEEHAPAVVVLSMPPPGVASALEMLGALSRVPPVILLSPEPHEAWTTQARRAGVRAVLSADATADALAAAITATRAGLLVLHPDALRGAPSPRSAGRGGSETSLTPREAEILEMMAEGMSNRTIAARLEISSYTVKFHVASILAKLGAATRTEAVTLGVRHGLISL